MIAGGIVMGSAGIGFAFGGQYLTRFFLSGQVTETGQIATQLLRIVATSMPPLAVCMIGAGTLRGAGDTRWPLVITLLGFCLIRIPLAVLLGWSPETVNGWFLASCCVGLGVQGAWISMVIDLWIRAALILSRLAQGGWQKVTMPA